MLHQCMAMDNGHIIASSSCNEVEAQRHNSSSSLHGMMDTGNNPIPVIDSCGNHIDSIIITSCNASVGRNLWICDIHGSRCAIYETMDPYSAQKSVDCAEICGSRRVQSTDLPILYPDLTF